MRVFLLLVVVVVTTRKQSQLPGLAWDESLTKIKAANLRSAVDINMFSYLCYSITKTLFRPMNQ